MIETVCTIMDDSAWRRAHLCGPCASALSGASGWHVFRHFACFAPGSVPRLHSATFDLAAATAEAAAPVHRCECSAKANTSRFQLVNSVLSPEIYCGLPAAPAFVARAAELSALDAALADPDAACLVVIRGREGSGKTALATTAIRAAQDRFPRACVLAGGRSQRTEMAAYSLLAHSAAAFDTDLMRLGRERWREIGLDSDTRAESELLRRIRTHCVDPKRSVLFLLENATADGLRRAVERLPFGCAGVGFVVTAADGADDEVGADAVASIRGAFAAVQFTELRVGAFSDEDAMCVLQAAVALGKRHVLELPFLPTLLAAQLCNHALALRLFACLVNLEYVADAHEADAFLRHFVARHAQLTAEFAADAAGAADASPEAVSVRVCVQLLLERVAADDDLFGDVKRLLLWCAHSPPVHLPYSLFDLNVPRLTSTMRTPPPTRTGLVASRLPPPSQSRPSTAVASALAAHASHLGPRFSFRSALAGLVAQVRVLSGGLLDTSLLTAVRMLEPVKRALRASVGAAMLDAECEPMLWQLADILRAPTDDELDFTQVQLQRETAPSVTALLSVMEARARAIIDTSSASADADVLEAAHGVVATCRHLALPLAHALTRVVFDRATAALQYDACLAHAVALNRGSDHSVECALLYRSMGALAFQQHEHERALELFTRALRTRQSLLGAEHVDVCDALIDVGDAYRALGRLPEALAAYEKCAAARQTTLGEFHVDTAAAVARMGRIFYQFVRIPKALETLQRAHRVIASASADRGAALFDSHLDLGRVQIAKKEYGDAADELDRVLSVGRLTFGPNHARVAMALGERALVAVAAEQWADAADWFQQTLTVSLRAHGPMNPRVAIVLRQLGDALQRTGRVADALPLFRAALPIAVNAYGAAHVETARAHFCIGLALVKLAQLDEAHAELERGLASCMNCVGDLHPDTAKAHANLGLCLHERREYAASLVAYEHCLRIQIATIDQGCVPAATWADVGDTHRAIAQSFDAQQRAADALHHFQACIKIKYGPELDDGREDDVSVFYTMSKALANLPDLADALPVLHTCLRLKLSVHGERHAHTAHTHSSIALVHHAQGNLPLALKHYQIASRIRAATLVATHPSVGANFYNVGTALEAMGRHKEAVDAYLQAIAIRRLTLGADRDADLLTANLQQACGFQLQMMRPPDFVRALRQYNEAFQIRVPIFGQANATVLKSYEFLGATIKRMGKLPPALERYADADNVAMRRELANLATALCAQAAAAAGGSAP